MSETVDLSGLDIRPKAQEGVPMPLHSPAGQPTRVVFLVRGVDSEAYNATFRAQQERRRQLLPRKLTDAEKTAEHWQLQAALVAGWTVDGKPAAIVLEKGGAPLECTPANVAKVLEQHTWIYEQVLSFATSRANFLPGPAGS